MTSDRDRLIELILKSEILCNTCGECSNTYCAEALADHLLANCVFLLPEDLRGTEDFSISAFIEAMQMYKEKDHINRLQAEKSNLEIELQAMRGAANSYKAEIERLKEIDETRHKVYMTKCEELEIAKSEAVKECVEKLKSIFGEWIYGHKTEDLLNELVGDSNGKEV